MKAFNVKVIDAGGALHRYVQLAATCAAAEGFAFKRFGSVRLLSVLSVQATKVRRSACI
jgi:hypothetical protein